MKMMTPQLGLGLIKVMPW